MKKKTWALFTLILVFVLSLVTCSDNEEKTSDKKEKEKVELTVSAAASLNDALTDIQNSYKEKYPEITLKFNFGASGALQQQISQGAPVDLFISAAEDKFNTLVNDGMIDKEESVNLVENELVLIVPKDSKLNIKSFEDLATANIEKMALGTPESVPAGLYGKETLEALKVWDKVESKLVYGKDVRQVLSYVETGNVDAGIVYKTDALVSDKIKIVATAGSDTHTPIIYPLGIIKDSKHHDEAKDFYDYLQSDAAKKILEEYGFKMN
ncbi:MULTISPECIES: molybdate ABC transporter substrate-binding protein [Bacillus]|uniref:molybdate ABC transporter substrate-binding protein n=1 Tax=Bacillus TaxID=1386 RepID=UPI0002FDBFAF|nr:MULTISPECIES: molybdate ABC transporter substrate-binding protein [Bacillus]